MQIQELLNKFRTTQLLKGNPEAKISFIQSDSRRIKKNDIFCVCNNFGDHTPDYIQDALKKGASTVLIGKKSSYLKQAELFENVILTSADPMQIQGFFASLLKGEPSKKLKIIAITGTNGKTSMTYILNDILSRENKSCGIIGTIQTSYGNKVIQTGYTTPDASSLNEILADMVETGVEYVFLEASSHGLKLGRLNGIDLLGGIFTNITQDHMDFHPTFNDYLLSKFQLFKILNKSSHKDTFAVVSTDSHGSDKMSALLKKHKNKFNLIEFGKNCQYEGKIIELSLKGVEFNFKEKNKSWQELKTNLLGNFNYTNVSLAIVTALALKVEMEFIKSSISSLNPVNGRFQIVYNSKKTRIGIVDYAHTPDALLNVLKSIKEIPHSKLICLFGCGGDRDKTKRPVMAKIASKYADMVIITSDNPRTEDPDKILDDIEAGFPKKFTSFLRITNRKQAIKKGVEILPDSGILLVAGKGHETVQIIGNKKETFSDLVELNDAFHYDELSRK